MPGEHIEFGKASEKEAAEFLRSQGYKILQINYRTRFGEIDIIARDKESICFVEVKGRHSLCLGEPSEAVSFKKQSNIAKAAVCYLKLNNLLKHPARFDVLSILYRNNKAEVSLIKNAFELNENLTI
ncbi:MAG: YraN family protein [Candidatus Omnitrophica bacterium]|nr:YraN family protein [Candidatus Omnitrophota bacterium]MDD5660697.1 YraN family protein [Candidatus Omnitrophota bacterium]